MVSISLIFVLSIGLSFFPFFPIGPVTGLSVTAAAPFGFFNISFEWTLISKPVLLRARYRVTHLQLFRLIFKE